MLNPQRSPSIWRRVGPCLAWDTGLPCMKPCARYALLRTSPSRVQSVSFNICLRPFRGCKAVHLPSGAPPPMPAPHLSQQRTLPGAPRVLFCPSRVDRASEPDPHVSRCRASMAHTRQSRPGSRLDLQAEVPGNFQGVYSSLQSLSPPRVAFSVQRPGFR